MENIWNVQVYTRQIVLQIQQPFHNKFVVCCVIFLLSQRGQRAFFEGNDHSIGIAYSLPASIIRIFLQRNDTSPRLPTNAIQWCINADLTRNSVHTIRRSVFKINEVSVAHILLSKLLEELQLLAVLMSPTTLV